MAARQPGRADQGGQQVSDTKSALIGGGVGVSWQERTIDGDTYAEFRSREGSRIVRIRVSGYGTIVDVGYKPPGDAYCDDLTTMVSIEEFDRQTEALEQQAATAAAGREQLEREDMLRRAALIQERKAPVEVGEPGNEVIRRLRDFHSSRCARASACDTRRRSGRRRSRTTRTAVPASRGDGRIEGHSYVLRNNNGHTLRVVVGGDVPAGATWLGHPISSKAAVLQVEWTPAPDRDRKRLDRVPANEDEVVSDMLGRADELGRATAPRRRCRTSSCAPRSATTPATTSTTARS